MNFEETIHIWESNGISINQGADLLMIKELEEFLEFIFPKDFINFYSIANGFVDFDWNEFMFTIWSIERIKKEYLENDDKNFVGFSDYLIGSHTLGFVKGKRGIYKNYESYDKEVLICETFEEAINMILLNEDGIY